MLYVVILRGLPGSGKTTFTRSVLSQSTGVYTWVCSADHFFERNKVDEDGNNLLEYVFDPAKMPQAHAQCFDRYIHGLQFYGRHSVYKNCTQDCTIFVDNTNIHAWEISPYYRLAELAGVNVKIITFQIDPQIAASRNIHGVPLATIMEMARDLEAETEVLPTWWNHSVRHIV